MANNTWYIIDHSIELGHSAIFVISPKEVKRITMNGDNAYKFILEDKLIYFVDETSAFLNFDDACAAIKDQLNKFKTYCDSPQLMESSSNVITYK